MAERGGFHGYRKNIIPSNNTASGNTSSNISVTNNGQVGAAAEPECTVREQDRFMPIANVIRIMRKILPAHAKISDDAKETIQECVSEYISFITGEANERCQREQRKTITAEDVLWAMSKLGFDDYIEPLTLFLHRHRDSEGDRTSPVPAGSAAAAPPSAAFYRRGGPGIDYGAGAPPMPYATYYGPGNLSTSNGYYGGYGGPPPGSMSSGGGAGGSQSHTTHHHHHHHHGLNGGDQNSQLFKQ